jgi:transcriptional regulator with XRE-family HTH domain
LEIPARRDWRDNVYMRIDWLRRQMEDRGLSQAELARAVRMPGPALSKVMNGMRRLSAQEADAIRRHLGYRLPDDEPDLLDDHIGAMLAQATSQQKQIASMFLEVLTAPNRGAG